MSIIIDDKAAYNLEEVKLIRECMEEALYPFKEINYMVGSPKTKYLFERIKAHEKTLEGVAKAKETRERLIDLSIEAMMMGARNGEWMPAIPNGGYRMYATKMVDLFLSELKEIERGRPRDMDR